MSLNTLYFKGPFFKTHFILIMLLLPLKMVASYSNHIIGLKVIHGVKRDSIILTFDHPNPIAMLTPASFAESQENRIQRYFMPNTTISEDLEDEYSDIVWQNDIGLELVMHGRFVRKIVLSPNKIFIQTERI